MKLGVGYLPQMFHLRQCPGYDHLNLINLTNLMPYHNPKQISLSSLFHLNYKVGTGMGFSATGKLSLRIYIKVTYSVPFALELCRLCV